MSKKNKKELKISQEEMLNSISNNSKLDGIHENDDIFFDFADKLISQRELMNKPAKIDDSIIGKKVKVDSIDDDLESTAYFNLKHTYDDNVKFKENRQKFEDDMTSLNLPAFGLKNEDGIEKNKLKEILFGKEEAVPLKDDDLESPAYYRMSFRDPQKFEDRIEKKVKVDSSNTIKTKVGGFDSFKKDFSPKLEFILSPRPAFGILGAAILIFFVFNIIPDDSIENINNPNSLIFRSAEYSKDELVYVQIEDKNLVIKQFDDLDRDIKIYKDDKLIIQKGLSDLEEQNNEMIISFNLKNGSYNLVISFFNKIIFEQNFIIQ